jgi:hypothetical protein
LIILQYKLTQIPIHIYAIFVSLIASVLLLAQKNIPGFLKLFPFFLFVTLVVELLGAFVRVENNTPLYNFFSIVEFIFYLFVIKKILINRRVKRLMNFVMIVYPIAALANIFLIQRSIYRLHITTYSIGCLLIVMFSIYYFYELFRATTFVNLKREPAFWIITGLLFFYTCSFPIFGFANFISGLSVIARNIGSVLVILNVILYILFAVGFLCKLQIQRLTL